jgi:hypothetical protein
MIFSFCVHVIVNKHDTFIQYSFYIIIFFLHLLLNFGLIRYLINPLELVVLTWVIEVCPSQSFKFDSPLCQFWWVNPYRVKKNYGFKLSPRKWTVGLVFFLVVFLENE